MTRTIAKTPRTPNAAETVAAETATERKPLLDVRALLEKIKLPGVDVSSLIDSRRKDVEALLAANEQAYRGIEALTRRQTEMLSDAMKGLSAGAKDTLQAKGATERAQRVAVHAQQALGQALADMRELAEMSARSQAQVMETLNKRLREGIDEIGERIGGRE